MFGSLYRILLRLKAWWLFGHLRTHVYGNFSVTNPQNMRLGTNLAINHGVFLLARSRITIGDNVVLSARCMIIDARLTMDPHTPASNRDHDAAPIIIEDGVWIGSGAIILGGVTIGRNSVVGAGSVVTRDVPRDSVVVGNPARPIPQDQHSLK